MMPRGVRRVIEQAGEAGADSHAQSAQSTDQVVRSRDEEEAERVAAEFLKNNRMNLTGFEQRLPFVPERPGWVRRWVNDMNSRVPSLIDRGWRIVPREGVPETTSSIGRGNTDVGNAVSVVSTAGDGPMRVVLMEVPKKLFDMQMDALLDPVRQTEQSIKAGRTGIKDSEHVYTPTWANHGIETSH